MEVLYDSENFSVVHVQLEQCNDLANAMICDSMLPLGYAFEIIDKHRSKGIFLHNAWAKTFDTCIKEWQANTPTQEHVEDTLGSYVVLAQFPMIYH